MSNYTPLPGEMDLAEKPYHHHTDEETLRYSSSNEDDILFPRPQTSPRNRSFFRTYFKIILAHILASSFNLAICFAFVVWLRGDRRFGGYGVYGPESVYTPIKSALNYEVQKWDSTNIYFLNGTVQPDREAKYFGPPSQESDDAWAELIQYQNIRLTHEEMEQSEYKDMPGLAELADKSGYFVTLSAYHSIHCIKRLHHLMFFDQYYPNMSKMEEMWIKQHGEHCLNILLQTVRCNPDLSILPMQWGATTTIPVGIDDGHHQCYNWDRIDEWMKERNIDVFKPGTLVHPTLGEAYPGGKGNEVGIAIDHLISKEGKGEHMR